jgi:hypothetical protein
MTVEWGIGGVERNAPDKIGVGAACAFAQRLEEKHSRVAAMMRDH